MKANATRKKRQFENKMLAALKKKSKVGRGAEAWKTRRERKERCLDSFGENIVDTFNDD